MEERIVDGVTFRFVQEQRSGSRIYRSSDTYLRIGGRAAIEQQLQAHKRLESLHFPIPKLLSEGEANDERYFIESSLGEKRFLELFEDDTKQIGSVGDTNFTLLLKSVERFLAAQIATKTERDVKKFGDSIHLEVLKSELPSYAKHIQKRYEDACGKLRDIPYVVTHGDFNPANIYPDGVIDFENTAAGPLGYDIACVTASTDWFPLSGDFEYKARYLYTSRQKDVYVEHFDKLLTKYGMTAFKSSIEYFEFMRAIWLTARMHKWPRLQKYRYDMFIGKYLS